MRLALMAQRGRNLIELGPKTTWPQGSEWLELRFNWDYRRRHLHWASDQRVQSQTIELLYRTSAH